MKTSAQSYYAFFDVDETLVNLKSMFDFLKFYYQAIYSPQQAEALYQQHYQQLKNLAEQGLAREQVNLSYYQLYKGHSWDKLNQIGLEWFEYQKRHNPHFYHSAILNEIKQHQDKSAGIVLVSGSFLPCLKPIELDINADATLCINPVIENGILSGDIIGIQTIGQGKADAIKNFIKTMGFSQLNQCYAYGDHISDLAMLSCVGNPVVFPNCNSLIQYAKAHSWKILQ
ncbi:MAG: HAD-superfamily subfamily hydrolase [Gammaproteobacteria bacterium]|nr:HAD-superfamily subfamily hydrolase [Gammaproteobacteria bacterium]